jgi:hypothetical protein
VPEPSTLIQLVPGLLAVGGLGLIRKWFK